MKTTILVFALTLPGLVFGQSLAEVAKKEKDRRETNKKQGKEVTVLSEEDIARTRPADAETSGSEEATSSESYSSSSEEYSSEYSEEGDVPTFIPSDRPLPERIRIFELMKQHYLAQAAEIDTQIRENEVKIQKAQADLAATSTAGGTGLPVAPSPTPVGGQLTGQDSVTLASELNRLQAVNDQLRTQKDQLKLDLQEKGRVAGIPPGYLRF